MRTAQLIILTFLVNILGVIAKEDESRNYEKELLAVPDSLDGLTRESSNLTIYQERKSLKKKRGKKCKKGHKCCKKCSADYGKKSDVYPYCIPYNCNNKLCPYGYRCCGLGNICCLDYGGLCPETSKEATNPAFAPAIETQTVPEGQTLNVWCGTGPYSKIHIISALYTRVGDPNCPTDQGPRDTAIVQNMCQLQPHCEVQATDALFGDPCRGLKTLRIVWSCSVLGYNDMQQFEEFKNGAVVNYGNEIESLSCPTLEDFKLSHGGCSVITWLACLHDGYKDYKSCKVKCGNNNYKCLIPCIIQKLDTHPKCKKCIKALIKAICCHFVPKSQCCDKTYEELLQEYNIKLDPACSTVDEYQNMQIFCEQGSAINITSALFGRVAGPPCGNSVSSLQITQNHCQGKNRCTLYASPTVYGTVHCQGHIAYLSVCHACVN